MSERMINVQTMSGDAWIDLHEVVAMVCHLPNRDNYQFFHNICNHLDGSNLKWDLNRPVLHHRQLYQVND